MRAKKGILLAGISVGLALAGVFAAYELGWIRLERGPAPTLQNGGLMRELLRERAGRGTETDLIGEIPEEHARMLFAMLSSPEVTYDPALYFRRVPNLAGGRPFPEVPGGAFVLRTNSAGFREDAELPEAPDKRVLVLGDSHTDGVCLNPHSFANRLETELARRHPGASIDVVNAGTGGYSFYNYLRGLERFTPELRPDVFVCAVYGGNDFLETLAPRHYFAWTDVSTGGPGYAQALERFQYVWGDDIDAVVSQGVQQLAFLNHAPEEAELALATAKELTRRMAARADELGVELVFVYLPSAWDVQLERYTDAPRDALCEALGLDGPGSVRSADPWADEWAAVVRELGVPLIDLRERWRGLDADRFWHQDQHINLAAQYDVARELYPLVERLLGLAE